MTKPTKLFIIEDDATIVNLLTEHLADRYQVTAVTNFRNVLAEVQVC